MQNRPWPPPVRALFRFTFLYWVMYLLPAAGSVTLLDLLPWDTSRLSFVFAWPLARLSHVVGVHLFHLTGDAADWHPSGSGDTAMNFVLIFCIGVLALIGATIWTFLDETRRIRPRQYNTAYAWLRLVMRFTLGIALIGYGYAKLFPSQFGLVPDISDLNQTLGESSPIHILRFFLTLSRPYAVFGGLAELIPGFMLLFRRTTTLGLFGAIAVMADVVAMNFTYDVPAKLYSLHLLLMALFLLLPDLLPLWRFFIGRKAAMLTGTWVKRSERKALRTAGYCLQGLLVISCLYMGVQTFRSREKWRERSPIRGIWAVDSIEGIPGDAFPKTLTMDNQLRVSALTNDGPDGNSSLPVHYDAKKQLLRFPREKKRTEFHWTPGIDARHLRFEGQWNGMPVSFNAHRTDRSEYPVMHHSFHWVDENAFDN